MQETSAWFYQFRCLVARFSRLPFVSKSANCLPSHFPATNTNDPRQTHTNLLPPCLSCRQNPSHKFHFSLQPKSCPVYVPTLLASALPPLNKDVFTFFSLTKIWVHYSPGHFSAIDPQTITVSIFNHTTIINFCAISSYTGCKVAAKLSLRILISINSRRLCCTG